MSVRQEELSPEELALQDGLNRSWANAKRALSDPAFVLYVEESIARVNESRTTATMSKDAFITSTESTLE